MAKWALHIWLISSARAAMNVKGVFVFLFLNFGFPLTPLPQLWMTHSLAEGRW
jgi:hypothetical protein